MFLFVRVRRVQRNDPGNKTLCLLAWLDHRHHFHGRNDWKWLLFRQGQLTTTTTTMGLGRCFLFQLGITTGMEERTLRFVIHRRRHDGRTWNGHHSHFPLWKRHDQTTLGWFGLFLFQFDITAGTECTPRLVMNRPRTRLDTRRFVIEQITNSSNGFVFLLLGDDRSLFQVASVMLRHGPRGPVVVVVVLVTAKKVLQQGAHKRVFVRFRGNSSNMPIATQSYRFFFFLVVRHAGGAGRGSHGQGPRNEGRPESYHDDDDDNDFLKNARVLFYLEKEATSASVNLWFGWQRSENCEPFKCLDRLGGDEPTTRQCQMATIHRILALSKSNWNISRYYYAMFVTA